MQMTVGIFLGAFVVSFLITVLLVIFSERLGLTDVPNERSMHEKITARGGGISFVAVTLAVLFYSRDPNGAYITIAIALLAVAIIGLLDDRFTLGILPRLLTHLAAAGAVTYLFVTAAQTHWGVFLTGIVLLFLAALINFYNFMDGIDGIAAIQALCVSGFSAYVCHAAGDANSAFPFFLLFAAVGAFTFLNWSPAKIFMGDVGSGFLGLYLGAFCLWAIVSGPLLLPHFLTFMAVFLGDTGWTMGRRILRREYFWRAHREHAYQKIVQAGRTHAQVSSAVLVFNLGFSSAVILAPTPLARWLVCAAAYAVMLVISYRSRAGTIS